MIFLGNPVDAFHRNTLYRDESIIQYGKEIFRQITLDVLLHQYFVNLLSGLYGFDDGSYAEYHFVLFYHIKLFICLGYCSVF